jgi:mannosyl-3-phosphoglycerate phosphatase
LQRAGFRCTPHGRFYHLTGNKDERQPFRKLKSLYRKAWGELRTVGVGVRLAHLAFLREADLPIVLPGGGQEETARLLGELPAARLAGRAGPPGWNEVIVELVGHRTLQAAGRSLEG